MKRIFNKKTALIVLFIFLTMQLFRIDKRTLASDPIKDFMALKQPSESLGNLIKNSCYDCHSNQARYPWYTNIAPVSWWIKHHVNEGTEHLNFSDWGKYSARKADHKLKECVEMLEENEMPLPSYLIMHKEATLTKDQKKLLEDYFGSLRNFESDKPKEKE